jgi:predicted nucleic acid-binding protein
MASAFAPCPVPGKGMPPDRALFFSAEMMGHAVAHPADCLRAKRRLYSSRARKRMLPMGTLKIYLDNCSYNRPFDNQAQVKIRLETEAKLYVQAGIRKGKYALVWSYLLDFENSANPYEEKRNAIALWKEIADEYCPASDDVLAAGRAIMEYGIKARDALHIACAIKNGCDYFITTDWSLTNKKITDIKIINPIDFVRETEEMQ